MLDSIVISCLMRTWPKMKLSLNLLSVIFLFSQEGNVFIWIPRLHIGDFQYCILIC